MDDWLPLKRLGGLMKERLACLSKNQAKNLIKTGSLKKFLEFSNLHQKKGKTHSLSRGISVFLLLFSAETETGRVNNKFKIMTALQQEHAESHINDLNFMKSFRKGAATEFSCYLDLLQLVLSGAFEL